MINFLSIDPEIFGIDVNDLALRLVKLKKTRRGFRLASFNELAMPPGIVKEGVICDRAAFSKMVRQICLTAQGMKLDTRYVAVALPEEKSFSQVISMPAMSPDELASAVPYEVENYIPLSTSKVYFDFQPIAFAKEGAAKTDVLVNAMPKSIIDVYVACIKEAGLIPWVLEVESQSIARALLPEGKESAPCILIDFGKTKTSFSIYSGNSVRFTSSMPFSSHQLTRAIAEHIDVSEHKAEIIKKKYGIVSSKTDKHYNLAAPMKPILSDLAAQIEKYLDFYRGHFSQEHGLEHPDIQRVILCGGGSHLKNLPEFLSAKLHIPAEVGNPFMNISVPEWIKKGPVGEKALSYATAIGLALRQRQD